VSSTSINIESKDVNIVCKNNAKIDVAKTAFITGDAVSIKAKNINSEAIWSQKGNVEIDGTCLIKGAVTTQNGITNSGSNLVSNGKTFETHTHSYNDVTQVIAPSGGGMCNVTKTPTNTGATN
jgi:phage baseplate assembly protein gpV